MKRGREEGSSDMDIQVTEAEEEAHPYAFHVSGPRNVASPNWRDLINSSWKDENYKRTVIACFIQAVYLLELDRQEHRTEENALAPKWWTRFKYKLTQTLVDERDGSIFGAVLEWDRTAAFADMILIRPSGAPKAVLALRGTLLKGPTMRRDIEDDLRFLAWESLKGSVRFKVALDALKLVAESYGSSNVCIAGHSLGAGFALQVGKTLAKEGVYAEAHLFNPPSISIAMSLRNIGEKAGIAWKKLKSMLPSNSESQATNDAEDKTSIVGLRNWVPNFREKTSVGLKKWVPHLYVNNSDYICCYYTDPDGGAQDKNGDDKENRGDTNGGQVAAKLFVMSKGKQKFMEAHGLEQWWSDDLQLQLALNNSKLISRQLKSLYSLPAPQPTHRM
ncbi:GDSL esterase/lipase At4g10955 [Ricinus communis]|uniref:Triacylglycerol lipase, putative n=1 Tax=Ricinus communis TaxID=3988 RepID=B9SKY0_RICCO|nr:GDSL esterase/lipase At4g10955 [Ricinus communis]EEF35737.1 triacylglycerol lipase, putative [Ricinus communis]|eukprot:XP_002526649.1 GDSL esterase/lipase At4g10955 [Ricinus communis]